MADPAPDPTKLHIIEWSDCKGQRYTQELHHFPTAADVPAGAVRMDVALPWPTGHDYPACALFRGGRCTCDAADPPVMAIPK